LLFATESDVITGRIKKINGKKKKKLKRKKKEKT
jgi:hypothetical protein